MKMRTKTTMTTTTTTTMTTKPPIQIGRNHAMVALKYLSRATPKGEAEQNELVRAINAIEKALRAGD